VVVLGSRQIGKTFVISEKALEESFNGMGRIILVCAFMVDTTGHVKRYLRSFIKQFPEGWFVSNMNENYIENTITGNRIYFRSLSEGGDRVRGFTAHVVIMDECFLIDNEVFEKIILPTTTTTGGQIFLISTPGPKNWFWKECVRAKS
jgi:phage terminase large subunit-like protein